MTNRNILHNFILFAIDAILLVALFYLATFIRASLGGEEIPVFNTISLSNFVFIIFIILFFMQNEKIYNFRYDFWQETKKILKSVFLSYLMALTLLALMKTNFEYSRLFLTIYFISAILLLPLTKRTLKKILYSFDFFKNPILVLGEDIEVEILKDEFTKNFYLGQRVSYEEYSAVVIISKGIKKEELDKKIEFYLNQKVDLYIIPYLRDINFVHSNILEYYNIRTNAIHIENRLLIKRNIWIKRLSDTLLTLLVLPIFSLLHLLLSLLIKLDSKGDIFFRQNRLGKDNQNFLCYKYRTMHEKSDELLTKYLEKFPSEVGYYEEYHKYKNDPRVTKIGRVLRATSLDELPQIINIIKGEMSWVGPRPYMLNESDKLGDNLSFILRVRPGITGLWQVSGRNNLTFKERNELEVWYIKNWLLWDDFVILVKTIKVVLLKIGAK